MTEWLHKDKEDFINTSFAKKTNSAFCYEYDPFPISHIGVSLVAQWLRIHLPMQMWVRSLGGEDPLEEEITTHPSILAWKTPWIEEPGEPQSMGSQKNRTHLATEHIGHIRYCAFSLVDSVFKLTFGDYYRFTFSSG